MKTLVIGASLKPDRYSHKATQLLVEKNVEVIPLGPRAGSIAGIAIETEQKAFPDIDTVTLYLGPQRQKEYQDYVISLNPRRVIFNPGTENDVFENVLQDHGISTERACTLVLLRTNQYEA